MIWQIFSSDFFLGFWNFEIDDVTPAILYFLIPALSRAQFAPIFFQIKCKVQSCLPVFAIEN